MKKVTLKRVEIENFKGIKNKMLEFGTLTTIKGVNKVGKSTVYDAVLWVLFDKLADGSSATGIRPHDIDGIDIDYIDIVVTATFDVDGKEISIKKTQKQKWVKKRGSEEKKFEGNVNEFEINSIPKDLKDVKPYITEHFCLEDAFLACSNAMSFFKLDTKKRRVKLMELAKEFTNADVIETNTEFVQLADMLDDGTVEELVTRSKSTIKRLNEQLKTIPARIDEQEKSKVDIDTAELELQKNAIQTEIDSISDRQLDTNKQYEEYSKASDGILELKFELNDLQRKANEELIKQKRELQAHIDGYKEILSVTENNLKRSKDGIKHYNSEIEIQTNLKNSLIEKWKMVNSEVFDENTTVCPTCHRLLPEEEIKSLREQFEKSKADRLADIVTKGNEAKEKIASAKELIESLTLSDKDNIDKRNEVTAEIVKLEKQLSDLPQSVDISTTEEYLTLTKQITEKEKLLANTNSIDDVRRKLEKDKSDLLSQLNEVNSKIAKSQRNVDIDERISELQEELRTTSQKIADEEKILDLLERFNRTKMNMLTEAVNKHFKTVKWKLFTENINGGYSDCCKALVGGSDYENGLNHGDRILADIDILNTFQKLNNIQLPIWVDDSESVDEWRIPKLDTQMIILRRTDDKELVVER